MIQTSRDRDNSGRVRTPEKNSGVTVGHNNAKHFLCPISSQHSLEFLKIIFFEGKALGTRLGWAEFATKVRNNRLRSRWALHFSDFFFFLSWITIFADQNNTKANYHVMYVGNILFKSVLNKWHNRLFSTHFKPSTRHWKISSRPDKSDKAVTMRVFN